MKLRSFIFLNFLFSALPVLFSQNELGNPYIHNYTPKEYNSSATIWEITQDHKGLMYFGVAEGVIQYDGTNWQTVVVDNQTTVRSMDVDENGVVYIGAKTEFGYIGRDSLNSPVYVSLSRQLEEKYQDFADVWNVYATKDGVFFLTFKRIYRWHNDQLFTYEYDDITAHLGYYVNDQLFLVLSNRGLHVFENDRFVPVPGGMHFQGESIYCILPFDKDHIIVATRKSGLEKLNTVTGETVLFENDVNEQLKDDKMYSGTMSETGDFVLATLKNGIYVIQKSGKLVAHINQQNGLQNNNVKYVFKDNFGGIWAGTAVGISFIDLNLPLTYFNDENGVSGFTRDVVRHNGTLYVATGNGLFFLDKREIDPQKKFKQLDNADDQFWDFLIVENHLLVGGSHGFYEIIDNKLSRIASFNSNAVFNVLRSNQNPSLIYLALKNGIALAKLNEQGEINVIHQFRDLEVECHQLGEDRKGNLWVATAFDYALRINQTSFDESQGFPLTYEKIEYGEKLSTEEIIRIGDELYMTSSQGLLRAEDDGKLTLKNPFNILNMPEDFTIRRLQQDQNGNLWIHYHFNKLSGQFLALKSPDGTYTIKDDPFTRINEKVSHINSPYVEDNGIVWFHGGEGIVRYDLNKDNNSRKDYRVNIRKVIFSSDSVVKYGNNETHEFEDYQFSFKNNATSFTFSAASYGNEKANQYQYFLEGQDEAWSEWTTMSTKEYNYLHEGKYVFRVRAKNIYNQISQEDQFTFVILPPWYRETWAYVFYVFLFLIFVFIIIKVATYRLEKSKRQLEKVVEERTKDIVK
ncbi:MAG: hypothetical protein KDD41_00205, partial [Flavobacteriales bacterium]|nr:hypothetical protein [Flavobacteriales bacterium]